MDARGADSHAAPFSGEAPLIFVIRAACLGLLAYWTLVLLRPFLGILIWSVVFTVALYPAYEYLSALFWGRRKVAAAAITLVALGVMFGPATWLGLSLADNIRLLIQHLGDGSLAVPPPPGSVRHWPLIGERIYEVWQLASTNIKDLIEEIAPQLKPVGGRMLAAAGSIGVNLVKFVLAIIISGFLFVPGRSLVMGTKNFLSHIATRQGGEFVDIAGATIRNISRGVIGIAFLQALLAGIGFLVAGLPCRRASKFPGVAPRDNPDRTGGNHPSRVGLVLVHERYRTGGTLHRLHDTGEPHGQRVAAIGHGSWIEYADTGDLYRTDWRNNCARSHRLVCGAGRAGNYVASACRLDVR